MKIELTQDILKELIHYEPHTGHFYWKFRDKKWFDNPTGPGSASWNSRYAYARAFTSNDKDGYKLGTIFTKGYRAHNIAWLYVYGSWPNGIIDHINGKPWDNRIENLRDVTKIENDQNKSLARNNKSGIIGVDFWPSASPPKQWVARISTGDGKRKFLGYFLTKEEAAESRAKAEIEYGYHENHGKRKCQ
jgi:hypothetical protein